MDLTTIYLDWWTCTCTRPDTPDPAERMGGAKYAETAARAHAEFYNNRSWPHEVRLALGAGGAQ